ncbi:MAG: YerC/YecD family TrpR-related protein [Clostridia bacterium]|nr:YerC/YecD family TrpR-related protein [Clostridia bacterium]
MNIKSDAIDRLFESILKLETVEDCYKYFEDLCTVKEIQDMAQRLEAAILLNKGDSYQMIVEKTGLSTATIGRVSKCLNYGSGGYLETIARLGAGVKNTEKEAASTGEDK